MPEVAFDRLVKDLVVADGCLQERVPIHQPFAAINQALAEEAEEGLADGAGAAFVERETSTGPVARAAHLFELIEDSLLVNLFPLPDSRDEPFAPQVVPRFALFFPQPFFDDGLSGDSRVIRPWHPERVVALHPVHADLNILQRVIEGVP